MSGLTSGGSVLTISGSRVRPPEWHDLLSWTHSWDAKDASLYVPSAAAQTAYGIDGSQRMDSVPDRGSGARDLLRDDGAYGVTIWGQAEPFPGLLHVPSSPMFNGRPMGKADLVVDNGGSFDHFAMLTPNASQNSPDWFNAPNGYPTPYLAAVLCRQPNATNRLMAAIDSSRGDIGGGPTIGCGKPGSGDAWSATCFDNDVPTTKITLAHVGSVDETVGVIYFNSGVAGTSFFELNWRTSGGALTTERKTGTQLNTPWPEMFHGYVETTYWSASGIMLGTPTAAQTDKVRSWMAQYIPSAGTLTES